MHTFKVARLVLRLILLRLGLPNVPKLVEHSNMDGHYKSKMYNYNNVTHDSCLIINKNSPFNENGCKICT